MVDSGPSSFGPGGSRIDCAAAFFVPEYMGLGFRFRASRIDSVVGRWLSSFLFLLSWRGDRFRRSSLDLDVVIFPFPSFVVGRPVP